MSDGSGSSGSGGSGRRRRSGRSNKGWKGRIWAVAAVLLIVAVGLANLALYGKEKLGGAENPGGFLTPKILLAVGLWVPLGVLAVMAWLGIRWSRSGFGRGKSLAFRWALASFGFAFLSILVVLQTVYDPDMFPRERLVVVFVVLLAAQVGMFAMMMRASAGAGSSRGRRRRRRSSSAEEGGGADDASRDTAASGSTAGASGQA